MICIAYAGPNRGGGGGGGERELAEVFWTLASHKRIITRPFILKFDFCFVFLKGHGNEADFLGFLQKSVRHRFPTLNFELFRFGLRIRGDIRNRKTTPRLGESGSRQECL
jgi:hypothetical protein